LRAEDWFVQAVPLKTAQDMVREHHYARGGSNTAVYTHGLFYKNDLLCVDLPKCRGIVWWLPPTRVACESVNKGSWRRVLSLTRMVLLPDVPRNAASFLLSRSVKMIRKDGRFDTLVTYADESQGHTGGVYKASNWAYIGRTGPYPRWLDSTGKQVAQKATKNRVKSEMEALGHIKVGSFHKHKYVLELK